MISEATIKGLSSGQWATTFRSKGYSYPITVKTEPNKIIFKFRYNKTLIQLVKTRFNAKWNPGLKLWHTNLNERALFQIDFLTGNNPYVPWDTPVDYTDTIRDWVENTFKPRLSPEALAIFRDLSYQNEMINLSLSSKQVMLAAEMGLGKTYVAIAICEILMIVAGKKLSVLWSAPNGPLNAAQIEFDFWNASFRPRWLTYHGTVQFAKTYEGEAPDIYIVDESSYCKNAQAQRTQAIWHIGECVRQEKKRSIILLTGTPDPKAPTDWFAQIEALQPGFIPEGNIFALQDRLGLFEKDIDGGYRKLVTWFDSDNKCKLCGMSRIHLNHTYESNEDFLQAGATGETQTHESHDFSPAENEVKAFGTRLKGIVGIWKTETCTKLPPQRFHMHKVEPSQGTLNIAKQIVEEATRGIDALTMLRTLSDGFIYRTVSTNEMIKCGACTDGKVTIDDQGAIDSCAICKGVGSVPVTERILEEYPCPKIDKFKELLECHLEVGRFVTYGAFQGSVDLLTRNALSDNWTVFQADGRGWRWFVNHDEELNLSRREMLEEFQSKATDRICFVGHAASAGVGITLHRSPSVFFYSCDFNPQNRFQAAKRVHRLGMSEDGGNVHDVVHLPSDERVLRSLINSQNLSNMTISELREIYS